jgi:hypothetical protein
MNGEVVLQLLFMGVFGGISAAIAHSKGRSAIGWFFGGFFLGCIGLIIILCLSNENERNAQLEAQQIQNRRLQEQLKQEQMKTESLRQHTLSRLDKHDEVLGISTRETAPQLLMHEHHTNPFAQTPSIVAIANPENDEEVWYFHYDGVQRGPTSINELLKFKNMGAFNEQSLVWKEGMENWEQAKFQPELAKVLYL